MAPGGPITRRGERRAAPDERPDTRLRPPLTAERETRRRRPGRVEAGSGTSLAGGGNSGGVECRGGWCEAAPRWCAPCAAPPARRRARSRSRSAKPTRTGYAYGLRRSDDQRARSARVRGAERSGRGMRGCPGRSHVGGPAGAGFVARAESRRVAAGEGEGSHCQRPMRCRSGPGCPGALGGQRSAAVVDRATAPAADAAAPGAVRHALGGGVPTRLEPIPRARRPAARRVRRVLRRTPRSTPQRPVGWLPPPALAPNGGPCAPPLR